MFDNWSKLDLIASLPSHATSNLEQFADRYSLSNYCQRWEQLKRTNGIFRNIKGESPAARTISLTGGDPPLQIHKFKNKLRNPTSRLRDSSCWSSEKDTLWCQPVMNGGVGHMAWESKGREGRSQAGPKSQSRTRRPEVGLRRNALDVSFLMVYPV